MYLASFSTLTITLLVLNFVLQDEAAAQTVSLSRQVMELQGREDKTGKQLLQLQKALTELEEGEGASGP